MIDDSFSIGNPNSSTMLSNYSGGRNKADERFKTLSDKETDMGMLNDVQLISRYDRKFLEYLVRMHNVLRGDRININEFSNIVDLLEHMKKEQEFEYLDALVHPEIVKNSKIPSQIPVPSTSFQLHQSTIISTNASGNAAIIFNPYYLEGAAAPGFSSFYVNNDVTLTGNASSNFFTAVNIGQTIPASVYNEYRLVSASIIIKYIGRLDIVQGVIGGSIAFDPSAGITAIGGVNANLAKYGDFNLAMDAYYTQENLALNGIRCLYFPLDSTFEQYLSLGTSRLGFMQYLYIYGGVPSSASYKVDVYLNYECLASPVFLHYIPATTCSSGYERKQEAIMAVQQNPITDESAAKAPRKSKSNFWQSVKETLGEYLPSIASIAGNIIPELKFLQPLAQAAGNALKG